MEIIGFIIIYIVIRLIIDSASNSSSSASNSNSNYNTKSNNTMSSYSEAKELKLSVDVVDEVINGKSVQFFKFIVNGRLRNSSNKIRIIIGAFDLTEEKQHVLNTFTDLQFPDSEFFCFTTQWIELKFKDAYFTEEIVITELPVESFVFPKKGNRKIDFAIEVEDSIYGTVNNANFTLYHQNKERGYVDYFNDLIVAENAIVKMALLIAGSDNNFHQVEVNTIKTFVKELSHDGDEYSETRQNELNDIIRNTIINSKNIDFKQEISNLSSLIKDKADNRLKHRAIEFFLQLVSVDEKYSKEEQELIELISSNIDYDPDRIRALKDKIISVSIHDELTDFNSLLGITPSMNVEDKRRHLRAEYNKWRQRATHSDPNIRDQANQMLKLISEERSKL